MEMKKLLIAVMFVFYGSQASAWVSKEFTPSNVDEINVQIVDDAGEGCWTNIGEVKRYAEDKLELAGHNVYRKRKDGWTGFKHYKLRIQIIANRKQFKDCYGAYNIKLYKLNKTDGVNGAFLVGEILGSFNAYQNVNQLTLKEVGDFMKEVEDPRW